MSDNHRLVKDVSHALKHYIDVRRKEEAFDLSGVYTPPYDIHKYRLHTNFGYAGVNDAKLKNYFPKNEFKKIFSDESNRREKFFRNELIYHLQKGTERRKKQRAVSSKNARDKKQPKLLPNRSRSKSASLRPATAYIPLGLLSIRSKPLPFLTQGEKKRVIQTTSMILSATDEVFHKEKTVKKTKRIDTDRTRENDQYLKEYMSIQEKREKEESEEYVTKSDSPSEEISEPVLVETKKPKKKTQPAQTEEIEDFNLLEAYEVKSGPKIKYVITVLTGSRLGSSTQATIKIKLFGDRFDNYIKATKWIKLDKSRTHKIPFQKGNEDEFQIEIFDIGILRAITIGHMEKEIKYSWFLEKVNIHEPVQDINYEFIFHKWFSQCTEDQKHIRTAFLTRAGYIPKADKKIVGVIKTSKLSPKEDKEAKIPYNDNFAGAYQPQKSITLSEYPNPSSTTSSKTSSSCSSSAISTPRKEVVYVEKEYLSSSASSTPRKIVNTITLETRVVESKLTASSMRSSSSSSSDSSSAIDVHKTAIEVRSRASSSSSSSYVEVRPVASRHSSLNLDNKNNKTYSRQSRSSSSSSNSSSATITPRNNAPEPVQRQKASRSPSSSASSETSTASTNKQNQEKLMTNLTVQSMILKTVLRRPESRSESSISSKNDKKEKQSDSDSKKNVNLKFTTEFDMNNLPQKPNPETYHINKNESLSQSKETAVVATVVTKQRKGSISSDSSSSSVTSSSTSSSSSSSTSSSTSSISVQKPVVKYSRGESLSPDAEIKLKEMSVRAFKLLSQNDIEDFKLLINESSKIILSRNSEEETLLSVACKKGYNKFVKFLVETDDILLSIDTPEGYCPIHFCATSNNLEGLKILFEHGALIDTQTNEGSTALHLAVIGGFLDICKFLVSKNAKIDIKDDKSKTPIDYASLSQNEAILEFLIKSKNNSNEDQKRYSTQMSIQSNATDKELAALEANENYTVKSPFGRPDRPAPIVEHSKDSDSESETTPPIKNEIIRSIQQSSLNDYTTIIKTNQTYDESKALEDLIKKVEMYDTDSSESEIKQKKNLPKLTKRKDSESSISNSIKNEIKSPNIGKMTNSLSDKTSTTSSESIKFAKPNEKKRIEKESVLSD